MTTLIQHSDIVFRGEEERAVHIAVEAEIHPDESDVGLPRGAEIHSVTDEDGAEIELTEQEERRISETILASN